MLSLSALAFEGGVEGEAWAEEDDQIRRPPESIYYIYYIHASIEICPRMYIFVVGPDHCRYRLAYRGKREFANARDRN